MSETKNYGLHLTEDSNERFQDWRNAMNGPSDSNMIKIDNALGEKADKSVPVYTELSASAWTGTEAPFTQEISVSGLTAEQNGNIAITHSASTEQREAARKAVLSVAGQEAGKLVIVADGKRPETNIPVCIILID